MKLLKSRKGFHIGGIITFVIGIVVVVAIIPIANDKKKNLFISKFSAVNDSKGNYTGTEQTLLSLIPLRKKEQKSLFHETISGWSISRFSSCSWIENEKVNGAESIS